MSRSGSLGAIPAGAARRRRRFNSVIGAWPRAFGAFEVGIYERRRLPMQRRISTVDEPRSLRSAAAFSEVDGDPRRRCKILAADVFARSTFVDTPYTHGYTSRFLTAGLSSHRTRLLKG